VRILFLVQHLAAAGPLRQLGTLAPALRERGHEVSLAGWREVDTHWPELWHHAAPAVRLDRRITRLRRVVRDQRPDVLYAYHGDLARFAGWLATRGTRTTLVWGVQGAGRLRRSPEALLARSVSRSVPLLIASSDSARERYAAGGYGCRRMVTIANGVDTDVFRPDSGARAAVRAEWGIGDELLAGLVARVEPGNPRQALFTDAAVRAGVRHVLVGDGTPLGFRSDMPRVYNALDVLCSVGLWEGFPNTVAEAMACGVPCVVSDAGDSRELVGGTGTVVPPGDVTRLAGALAAPPPRSDAIRERVVARFGVATWADATADELAAAAGSSRLQSSPVDGARRAASPPRARSRP
jgi:glycosyltransferase involved in cell wall biosynthesis